MSEEELITEDKLIIQALGEKILWQYCKIKTLVKERKEWNEMFLCQVDEQRKMQIRIKELESRIENHDGILEEGKL